VGVWGVVWAARRPPGDVVAGRGSAMPPPIFVAARPRQQQA
jgi:hypothetical protein